MPENDKSTSLGGMSAWLARNGKGRCRGYCFGIALPYARTRPGIDDDGCRRCPNGAPGKPASPVHNLHNGKSREDQ